MGSLALKVPAAQAGHGTDLGPDVGEGTQEGSVAKEHDMEDIDRVEQVPGLQDGEPRSLTGSGSCLAPRTDWKGFSGEACR